MLQSEAQRIKLYRKLNAILIDDCVVSSGFSRTRIYVWHKNVIVYPTENIVNNILKYVAVE